MKKFDTLYDTIIEQYQQQTICEGIISDTFDKIKHAVSQNLITNILRTRINNVMKTQKLTSEQLKKLKKLQDDAIKYQKVIKNQVHPIQKIKKDQQQQAIEQTITDLDQQLIKHFGSWWKDHLLKQNQIKQLAKAASKRGNSYPLTTGQLTEDN